MPEEGGFEVLITVDKNIPYQQNLEGRSIALLVIEARSNRLKEIFPYVPACLKALQSIKPGEVVRVGE